MERKPQTLQECYEYLERVLPPRELEEIRGLERRDLWQLHFSLAPRIEREILDDNPALIRRFEKSAASYCVDFSEVPDLIAEGFWDYLQIEAERAARKGSA